jgi:hypothetical protein
MICPGGARADNGGWTNGGKDNRGPHGVSQQNHQNLIKGQSDAASAAPVWATNNFGYGSQGQLPAGQIGGGTGARWTSSLRGIDPMNPAQPAGPQTASGPLGLVSDQPMPDWPFPPPIFNTRQKPAIHQARLIHANAIYMPRTSTNSCAPKRSILWQTMIVILSNAPNP